MELMIQFQLAEKSLRFYRNCPRGNNENEEDLQKEFEKFFKIAQQKQTAEKLRFSEFGKI